MRVSRLPRVVKVTFSHTPVTSCPRPVLTLSGVVRLRHSGTPVTISPIVLHPNITHVFPSARVDSTFCVPIGTCSGLSTYVCHPRGSQNSNQSKVSWRGISFLFILLQPRVSQYQVISNVELLPILHTFKLIILLYPTFGVQFNEYPKPGLVLNRQEL